LAGENKPVAYQADTPYKTLLPVGSRSLDKIECQRIVNDFGQAMARLSPATACKVLDPSEDSLDRFAITEKPHFRKFESSRLPHPPQIIREAIEFLLQYEKDPYNIETLHLGLEYLVYFE